MHNDEEIGEAIFLQIKNGMCSCHPIRCARHYFDLIQYPCKHVNVEMFAELSFKAHEVEVPQELNLYQNVEKNDSTGRDKKALFEELEVRKYAQSAQKPVATWYSSRTHNFLFLSSGGIH